MAEDHYQIVAILVKYALRQPLNGEEMRMLVEWRARSEDHAALLRRMRHRRWVKEQREVLHEPPTAEMWAAIREYIDETGEPGPVGILPVRRRAGYRWLSVVAVLLLVTVVGWLRWGKKDAGQPLAVADRTYYYKVKLTREDGSVIVLDKLAKGAVVLKEGDIQLRKADSNSYVYEDLSRGHRSKWTHHRLTIAPDAGICRVQWPDGSRVWLKSGSSLEYPVDGRSAAWALTGEAWFRIAHDAGRALTIGMPDGAMTRVLGTSFDINRDRVSLFGGSIRVVKGRDSVVLKPGSQVETVARGLQVKESIDSNAVLAWMRPKVKDTANFEFEGADLLTMLPDLADWYRVQVVNPAELKGVAMTAMFPRSQSLEMIIKDIQEIEDAHVRVRLKADTIYVLPLKPGG